MDIKSIKHAGRLKDIVLVLIKYGFDDIAQRLEVPGRFLLKRAMRVKDSLSTTERIRLAIEDLGPTFIKFGQIMSLRPDFLPVELLVELRKLHDEVPPVPFEEIRPHLEKNLGAGLDEVFLHFDETSFAAASLAQVHRAVLRRTRDPVAVKIQRPGIRKKIQGDVALLELLANQLHQRVEYLAVYNLPKLISEFKEGLFRELNYALEARNMRIFRANFEDDPLVHVPRLFEEFCTRQLLVMELVDGVNINAVAPDDPDERQATARRGFRVIVKQVLQDGFFHADPHPGNILIRRDRVLCLLDCGLVGRLTRRMRFKLSDLIVAVVKKDSDQLVDILLELTREDAPPDREKLHRELLEILDGYYNLPLARVDLAGLLGEVTDLLRRHRLSLPQNFAVMIKALITAEGTARELFPEMDVVSELRPLVKRLIREKFGPRNMLTEIRIGLRHLWKLQRQLPSRIDRIIGKMERGNLEINFRHKNLESLNRNLNESSSRLTLAIIIGSLIIASSLITAAEVGPRLGGISLLGISGYSISAILGLWIVIGILRSRR